MYVCHRYADPLDCVTILLFTVTRNLALKYAKVAILVKPSKQLQVLGLNISFAGIAGQVIVSF